MIKQCKMCKESKSLEEFTTCKANKDGRYSYCRRCTSIKTKKHYAKNPEKYKARSQKRSRETNRNIAYKRKYKIDIEFYEKMLEAQNGVCAICKKQETVIDTRINKVRNLAVDHCHATGKVRGLLCSCCNKAIGLLKDDPVLCVLASEYLTSKIGYN